MAVLAANIAAQIAALMAQPHADGIIFALTGTTIVLGVHYATKYSYRHTIDQPPPESSSNIEVLEDEQQTFAEILSDVDLSAPLLPGPNVPVPAIWGHPNTVSYTPSDPWNQALTLRVNNGHAHANSTIAGLYLLLISLFLLWSLFWLIGKCCSGCRIRATPIACADDGSSPGLTLNITPPNSRAETSPISRSRSNFSVDAPPPNWHEVFFVGEDGERMTPDSLARTPPRSRSPTPPSSPSKKEILLCQRVEKAESKLRSLLKLLRETLGKNEDLEIQLADTRSELESLRARQEAAIKKSSPIQRVTSIDAQNDKLEPTSSFPSPLDLRAGAMLNADAQALIPSSAVVMESGLGSENETAIEEKDEDVDAMDRLGEENRDAPQTSSSNELRSPGDDKIENQKTLQEDPLSKNVIVTPVTTPNIADLFDNAANIVQKSLKTIAKESPFSSSETVPSVGTAVHIDRATVPHEHPTVPDVLVHRVEKQQGLDPHTSHNSKGTTEEQSTASKDSHPELNASQPEVDPAETTNTSIVPTGDKAAPPQDEAQRSLLDEHEQLAGASRQRKGNPKKTSITDDMKAKKSPAGIPLSDASMNGSNTLDTTEIPVSHNPSSLSITPLPNSKLSNPHQDRKEIGASHYVPAGLSLTTPRTAMPTKSKLSTPTLIGNNQETVAGMRLSRHAPSTPLSMTPQENLTPYTNIKSSTTSRSSNVATPRSPSRKHLSSSPTVTHNALSAPTGPAQKHTCNLCGATFIDTTRFTYAQDHVPICSKWTRKLKQTSCTKTRTSGIVDIIYPPQWNHPLTKRPDFDPAWLTAAHKAMSEHDAKIKKTPPVSKSLPGPQSETFTPFMLGTPEPALPTPGSGDVQKKSQPKPSFLTVSTGKVADGEKVAEKGQPAGESKLVQHARQEIGTAIQNMSWADRVEQGEAEDDKGQP